MCIRKEIQNTFCTSSRLRKVGVVRQCVTRRTKIASSTPPPPVSPVSKPAPHARIILIHCKRNQHIGSALNIVKRASSSYNASAQCPALLVAHILGHKSSSYNTSTISTACITLSSTPHPIISYVHCTHIHPHTLQMQSANSVLLHCL